MAVAGDTGRKRAGGKLCLGERRQAPGGSRDSGGSESPMLNLPKSFIASRTHRASGVLESLTGARNLLPETGSVTTASAFGWTDREVGQDVHMSAA